MLSEQKWFQSRFDAAFKRLMLGQIELARQLAAQQPRLTRADLDAPRVVVQTPSYHRTSPRVSVLVPLYNHAEEVSGAMASVAASEYYELELVVLDDGSSDASQQTALDFLHEHPFLPAMLLEHHVNRGLGKTRNDLVASARGEYVFMLDADNEVYPPPSPAL